MNHAVGDGGGEIADIKRLLCAIKFTIEFKLESGHPKKIPLFQSNPLQWLSCECGQISKETRIEAKD